jgi:3-oxoacyl-[acyl-carrier-protein] synthase-3
MVPHFTRIAGVGSALPARIVRNADLPATLETSDDWIISRTGIRQRHIAGEGELTSDLALVAAQRALDTAGWTAADIDAVIVATTTPDDTFPATAAVVAARLGCRIIPAFDVQAVCSGFLYGLGVADSFSRAGTAQRVLLIGAEVMSRLVDWTDRGTCVLFGDGAGAFALEGGTEPGMRSIELASDGSLRDILYVDGSPVRGNLGHLRMQGREVFRHAVYNMSTAMQTAASKAGIALQDIDWVVPHQANQRILDGVARAAGIDPARVISTVADHANTSAASVPLAFDVAIRDGRIKRGHTVMLAAMGGGLTWGACVLTY